MRGMRLGEGGGREGVPVEGVGFPFCVLCLVDGLGLRVLGVCAPALTLRMNYKNWEVSVINYYSTTTIPTVVPPKELRTMLLSD